MTINQVFRKTFTPLEAKEYIDSLRKNIPHPSNFEEQILSSVGEEIYNLFFKYYTIKQWGVDPKNLPVSTARRIPIRFSYDDNYYTDRYQGIPLDGYTRVFERMLKHDCIHIELNTPFDMYRHSWKQHFKKLVFTGSLDDYFNHSYGYLPYRKVVFKKVYGREIQGNAVMNYTDNVTPYTRIHEHKWFTPEKKFDQSIGFEEYAEAANCTIDPYYPIRDSNSEFLYSQYRQLAQEEQDVLFVGRLAEFRYYDMHEVIGSSMSKFYALTDRNRL
jgi:UDP-galactopyranose mutase